MNILLKRRLYKFPLTNPPFSKQISRASLSSCVFLVVQTHVVILCILPICNGFFLEASRKFLLNKPSMTFVASHLLMQFVDNNVQNNIHFSQKTHCRSCSHMQWISHVNILCDHLQNNTIIHISSFSCHLLTYLSFYTPIVDNNLSSIVHKHSNANENNPVLNQIFLSIDFISLGCEDSTKIVVSYYVHLFPCYTSLYIQTQLHIFYEQCQNTIPSFDTSYQD